MEGCGTHRENFIKKNDLEDKSYSIKELSAITKVPMKTLREVYNRGIGAYKTQPSSVRMKGSYKKGVDAPMSAKLSKEQWAMARVYSFLDGNTKHDNDLRKSGGGAGISRPSLPDFFDKPHTYKFYEDYIIKHYGYTNDDRGKYGHRTFITVKTFKGKDNAYDDYSGERLGEIEYPAPAPPPPPAPPKPKPQPKKKTGLQVDNTGRWYYVAEGKYRLKDKLVGAGLWDYVKSAMSIPSKVVNEFVNPDSVARQGVNKVVNEVVNPDSIARRRISDISKGIRKDYPPSSRRVLEKYGSWIITNLTVRRDPVQSAINTAFNIITLGAWNKAKEAESMDRLFHLGIVATVEMEGQSQDILIEKNEVINIGMPKKIEADSTFLRVPTPTPSVTLIGFLQKGEARRPGGDFFKYDPFANNCQDFVAVLLGANDVYTSQARGFVKQDVSTLIQRLPSYTQAFARGITDLGGLANVAMEGGKSSEGSTPAYPFKRQLEEVGLEPSSYLEEARRRAKKHHYPYKLLGFAKDGEHKLVIPDENGRLSAFGKVGYGDHIIYSHLEKTQRVPKGTADAKRNTFQKSHTKIKGDWASKPFSPNNLALRVLW